MIRICSVRLAMSVFLLCLWMTAQAADEKRLVREAVEVARTLRQSENLYDQFAGAGILVEIGDKDSLQLLVDNLAHPDWSLMRSAIDTLLNVQHPAGLDVIYRYAAATEDGMFMKFLAESCAIRPREDMAEFLVESLELDDVWIRKHALQALAVTPLNNKETRMREIAEDEKLDATSRAYAYYALMDTSARDESLDKLIEISSNWGAEAQEAAAVALGLVDNAATRAAATVARGHDAAFDRSFHFIAPPAADRAAPRSADGLAGNRIPTCRAPPGARRIRARQPPRSLRPSAARRASRRACSSL